MKLNNINRKSYILVGICTCLMFFVVLFLVFQNRLTTKQEGVEPYVQGKGPGDSSLQRFTVSSDDHIKGELGTARVVVIMYSDTECPYCKSFHKKFQGQILEPYGKQVAWVYRHYPLSIYPRSFKEALALECAAEQKGNEGFWQYLEELFAMTPSRNGLDSVELPKIALRVSLNVPDFNLCLEKAKHTTKIIDQKREGKALGVSLTPSVIVWDKETDQRALINGANSRFLEVNALIEKYLKD